MSVKLMLGFGITVAISAIMMIIAIMNLQSVGGLTDKLYQSPFTVSTQSIMLQKELQNIGREMRGMVLYEDPSYIDSVLASRDKARNSLAIAQPRFLGDQQMIDDMYEILDELDATSNEIYQLVVSGKMDEAKQILSTDFWTLMKSGLETSQGIVDFALGKALEFNSNASSTLENARVLLIFLLVVMVALCAVIAVVLSRSVSRPVSQITDAAKQLAAGTLDIEIPYQARDELGSLAEAFREMSCSLKAVIADVDLQLGAMSQGNFAVSPQAEYIGDYVSIKNAIVNINASLSRTLHQINLSADQVFSSSEQVSSGAMSVSQGATEQASSVEELAATLAEFSDQVRDTSANAAECRRSTSQTGNEVMSSNQQMQEMISAMHEISDQSAQIRQIIKTIEDLAFQTNILALNASVESARAGEAGKGFAVVASEVRNLANKSTEASKHTSALIEDTIKAVEKGTGIANTTAKSLNLVVDSTKKVVTTVEKIASAAEWQAGSIAQITQGISQISSVVQANSATAEESAAASEELSGQAQMLKSLVGQFRLSRAEGTDVPRHLPG
ncbi:HAMP domain-containing methyl-accepting chemotaxis protein [Enterocloster asparagiformis]|uniref:methyl-accepting chemotaxis protein n=1 Tax=Enterocloster asparagiformis TaxID=333367 RepID=UPI002A8058DD|nr:HAMP domain-containing methyl-accepting chemotaxis protein [Enterocloster asparagiformis]